MVDSIKLYNLTSIIFKAPGRTPRRFGRQGPFSYNFSKLDKVDKFAQTGSKNKMINCPFPVA